MCGGARLAEARIVNACLFAFRACPERDILASDSLRFPIHNLTEMCRTCRYWPCMIAGAEGIGPPVWIDVLWLARMPITWVHTATFWRN